MMPAMRAVSKGSPFGVRPARNAATVSADINTRTLARARRAVADFPPVSTIATRPSSSTCDSSLIVRTFKHELRAAIQGEGDSARKSDDAHDASGFDSLHARVEADERGGAREGDEV